MFGTVLVANRGEIAVRVIRTLRRLGIRSVAVHSDADSGAPHVRAADVAVRIGPPPAAQSYLDIPAILEAAAETGAEAIHPGYGFLSENVELARACAEAGIAFVGPGLEALEVMGDKIAAKARVAERGVPLVPGSAGAGLDDAALTAEAARIGYPLLVKPSAGGGGKGMLVVRAEDELAAALASSRRVAASSFGDDTLLLERLVERPRHIEVQVLADRQGSVVHLGERECSLQRRHQKVIEEAPSPLLDAETRARIGDAACEVARSVGYEGAGTVEFLVSDFAPDTFFFIEMNTRLQVEHPVTEAVTGLDLVELQLRIAAGEPLPIGQDDVALTGHAIEARVYAESPARGFLPATGTVLAVREPADPGMRWDSGIAPGSVVTGDYDPMLAKAIAHGADRDEALDRLDRLLAGTGILGVETNVGYLRDLLADPDVRAGRLDTGLIDRRGVPEEVAPDGAELAAAALAVRASEPRPDGLWGAGDGWRLGASSRPWGCAFLVGDEIVEVTISGDGVRVGDRDPVAAAIATLDATTVSLTWRGTTTSLPLVLSGEEVWLDLHGRPRALRLLDRAARVARSLAARAHGDRAATPEVRATMPGTVVAVPVSSGDHVEAGAPLVLVEAMKMEHALVAPLAGVVRVSVRPGDLVRRDQLVAEVDPGPVDPSADIPGTDSREAPS